MSEGDALDAVFGVATVLAERGDLPPFPTEDGDVRGMAEWMVAAKDFKFFDVVLASLQGA